MARSLSFFVTAVRSQLAAASWFVPVMFAVASCAEGTGVPPEMEPTKRPDVPDAAPPVQFDPEYPITTNDDGSHGPDELGLIGKWTDETGTDSTLTTRYENGNVCLAGETAQVLNDDRTSYFGARATLNLCEQDGEARPVSECMSSDAVREFVGVRFSIEGAALPWGISVQINEAGRTTPARIFTQAAGEVTAIFERTTDPFDTSAPAVTPSLVTSITVRAAGDTEAADSFDFCVTGLHALFGEAWTEVMVPDWLEEPGPGKQQEFVGVNLVGAEFGEGNLPGSYGTDYIYPNAADMGYYAGKGMNVFRVPFRWERLQQEIYADLDETELGYVADTVEAAKAVGATVILDPHNFARYNVDGVDQLIGDDLEIEAFADFWAKLATVYANDDAVWFGLMNEPHDMETETWLAAANAAIAAIRDVAAKNVVLVPGNQWTGAHSWFATYYGTPNSEVMLNVEDPEDNFVFEFHQYFDSDSSGTQTSCVSETIGVERVTAVTDWLRENNYLGFLGEFGGSAEDALCLGAMDQLLAHLGSNPEQWLGWSVWASSEWGIQHNVRQVANEDSLQMRVLLRYLDAP